MNRYLLAGCAAVALAMGSGAANAQAKFEVKVGGDAYFEWGWVDQDHDAGLRSTEARNRFRFNLIPTAKADNGLEYGARIRVRADASAASNGSRNTGYDKAFVFASGAFGQVRAGLDATFNDDTIISRPIDYLPFGLFDQGLGFVQSQSTLSNGTFVGANTTGGQLGGLYGQSAAWPTFGDVNTRIKYFSPRFAGLQLGASYTPRNDDSGNSINRSKGPSGVAGSTTATATSAFNPSFQDLWEVGANYSETFGGVMLKGQASYYAGQSSDVAGASFKDLSAWQVGAQIGYAGFILGGSITDFGKSGLNKSSTLAPYKENATVYQLGAQYTTGPIIIGAGWSRGQDSGSVAIAGKRKVDLYEIGAAYTVAPGFGVGIRYNYYKADTDLASTVLGGNPDDKGSIVIVHSTLAF